MGHCITAIILKGNFDAEKAKEYDLFPMPLGFGLNPFHIDHYYSACWQHRLKTDGWMDYTEGSNKYLLPIEISIYEIIKTITHNRDVEYAIIYTDYFGGVGEQFGNVFFNAVNADKTVTRINDALRHLGVVANKKTDEFDTVGLGKIRSQPDYLDKYPDLADEYGV